MREYVAAVITGIVILAIFWRVCAVIATYEVSIVRRRRARRVTFPPVSSAYGRDLAPDPPAFSDPRHQDVLP